MSNKKSLVKQEWLSEAEYIDKPIYSKVKENIDYISNIFGKSFDLITRVMTLENENQKIEMGIVLMDGISDSMFVNQVILENMSRKFLNLKDKKKNKEMFKYFEETLLSLSDVLVDDTYGILINHILNGDTIIILDGVEQFFAISSKGFKERGIEEPKNDISVKGSKESFNENLATNVSLLRRRMRNPNLWVKELIVGKKTNCNIVLVYIKGLVDDDLIEMVEMRLNREDIESVVDSSYLKYYLREKHHSIFPLIYDTERPDTVIGNLHEGRFAIIVDGSPFVLIAPCTLFHFISSTEDYYHKAFVGSAFRIMRYLAVFFALFLPGLYMAIIKFNSELLPINLIYSIAGQRANVPLPSELEVFLTIFAFDLLTEAGTRMPIAVGTALSFVGAIIIGQAAVDADLISSMMLIIVALNGIGTLTIPNYDMGLSVKFLRYIILLASLALGLIGFAITSLVILVHLISLRSFGRPYLYPLAPLTGAGFLDSFIKAPLGSLINRKKGKDKSKYEKV